MMTPDTPSRTHLCGAEKSSGAKCRRRIPSDAKHCWQHSYGLSARFHSLSRNGRITFILTVLGTVLAIVPLIAPYVVGLLPTPRFPITVAGFRVTGGNASGCVFYMISFMSPRDVLLDDLSLTIQFPGNIAGYRFGAMNAFQGQIGGRIGLGTFELGKDSNGECEVKQGTLAQLPDLTITVAGPGMVQVRGDRILPKTMVIGQFAMSTKKPSFQPARLYYEGSFEYKKLGISVLKGLEFEDAGVQELKQSNY